MEQEKIFGTSLKRLEKIENIIHGKGFNKMPCLQKARLRDLYDRLEGIIAEIYYKRAVEPNVIKYVRENYIDVDRDMDMDMDFLTYDKYGYCDQLWNDYFILVNKDIFERFFKTTIDREIKNIENKNLKLF